MSYRTYASPPRRTTGDVSRSPPSSYINSPEPRVSIRVEQPVVGVEVNSHAFFRSRDGIVDDSEVNLVFRWSKSNTSRICANSNCPRNIHIHPGALKADVSCIMCARLAIPLDLGCFCSSECFKNAWKEHKLIHEQHPKYAQIVTPKENSEKERFPSKTMEVWTDVGTERMYTPTDVDLGHILRVECLPIGNNGERLAKATYVETNVVLPGTFSCLSSLCPRLNPTSTTNVST